MNNILDTVKQLRTLLCDPEGRVSIQGSAADIESIQKLLDNLTDSAVHDCRELSSSFQLDADAWAVFCFGIKDARCVGRRTNQFLEEALELVQAMGLNKAQVRIAVDYVYGKPIGAVEQEMGDVTLALALLATATGQSLASIAEAKLFNVWCNVAKIRVKDKAKPFDAALHGAG